MEQKNMRLLALSALTQVEAGKSVQDSINDMITKENLQGQDSGFFSTLVYTVVEKKNTCDYLIEQFSTVSMRKITPEIKTVLRLGMVQLIWLRTKSYAAINESVKLVYKVKQSSAKGFVNAVLRRVDRVKEQLPMPDKSKFTQYLSVCYNVSVDIAQCLLESYSKGQVEEILRFFETPAAIHIRVNTLKITEDALVAQLTKEGVEVEKDPELENCLVLHTPGNITLLESFRQGLFYVQDTSSQLAIKLAEPAMLLKENGHPIVLDTCAAPGGKSCLLYQYTEGKGRYYAVDRYQYKLDMMRENFHRLGYNTIRCILADSTKENHVLPPADFVLCDVVCSGLGILRKKPEIRYKTKKEIENLPEIQYTILMQASKKVKPKGKLVYSTCTLNKKENRAVVDRFLQEHREFSLKPLSISHRELQVTEGQDITFLPYLSKTDGFYIAVLERE